MAENSDYWERQTRAALRWERDTQIAWNLSSSNTINDLPSKSHHDPELAPRLKGKILPMDYSIFPVDHRVWKAMVPPDKCGLIWRFNSLRFFLDRRTGKNCFFLGAARLLILCIRDPPPNLERTFHSKSRFKLVAEFIDISFIDIRGWINTQMLSPETSYAAYLVFGFTENNSKLHTKSIISIFYDESDFDFKKQDRIVEFQPGKGRADGWMEIQLGDFYVGVGDIGKVEARLLGTIYKKSSLIVEGIEFRPLQGQKIKPKGKRNFFKL